jgi:hypothetical protein
MAPNRKEMQVQRSQKPDILTILRNQEGKETVRVQLDLATYNENIIVLIDATDVIIGQVDDSVVTHLLRTNNIQSPTYKVLYLDKEDEWVDADQMKVDGRGGDGGGERGGEGGCGEQGGDDRDEFNDNTKIQESNVPPENGDEVDNNGEDGDYSKIKKSNAPPEWLLCTIEWSETRHTATVFDGLTKTVYDVNKITYNDLDLPTDKLIYKPPLPGPDDPSQERGRDYRYYRTVIRPNGREDYIKLSKRKIKGIDRVLDEEAIEKAMEEDDKDGEDGEDNGNRNKAWNLNNYADKNSLQAMEEVVGDGGDDDDRNKAIRDLYKKDSDARAMALINRMLNAENRELEGFQE